MSACATAVRNLRILAGFDHRVAAAARKAGEPLAVDGDAGGETQPGIGLPPGPDLTSVNRSDELR